MSQKMKKQITHLQAYTIDFFLMKGIHRSREFRFPPHAPLTPANPDCHPSQSRLPPQPIPTPSGAAAHPIEIRLNGMMLDRRSDKGDGVDNMVLDGIDVNRVLPKEQYKQILL